jgi:hypothetical protein
VWVFIKTMGDFVKYLLTNADNTVYLGIPWSKSNESSNSEESSSFT